MASKTETAQLLRSLGFSYLEIARELYPQDYKRYVETRDRKLYQKLKLRVYRLLRGGGGRPFNGDSVDPQQMYTPELELDDKGGERDALAHREPARLLSPRVRKAGLKGYERQRIEYEQLLYHYYSRYVRDYDKSGVIWATAKWLHSQAFTEFYGLYSVNVWGSNRKIPRLARAYAYTVLSAAALVHGMINIRFELGRAINPDRSDLEKLYPIVLSKLL